LQSQCNTLQQQLAEEALAASIPMFFTFLYTC